MAVLEKIRVKFGIVISIIIALALLSFIIDPSTLESALNSMSSKNDVGMIAGKKVSYTDFQSDIDRYTTINELVSGSSAKNEDTQKSIRNAAWQELLDKYMFVKNAKNAGIAVGDAEMVELTSGENLSPVMRQNPVFLDESGTFSMDRLHSCLSNLDSDKTGRLRVYWTYLQNTIYNQQFYQKYGALFTASNIENDLQLKDDIAANNTTVSLDYCVSYYPAAAVDSTIKVSNDEISAFYNAHKKLFKQKASRDIEYVVFEVVPSDADLNAVSLEMTSLYNEFATTDNMKSFLLKNSEQQLSTAWFKNGDLSSVSKTLNDQIFSGSKVTQVIKEGNVFYAAREMDSKMVPDSAYVKHILLQGPNAAKTADSLVTVLGSKGANFSNLAATYSADKSSSADGERGNIGWMTQNYMIPGFESVLEAPVDKPFVLTTQYGTHVVVVTKKSAPIEKKQIAILAKTTIASKETYNKYYSQANTFSVLTKGSYDGYKKALDSTKVYSHSLNVTEATSTYGSIDQAKEVTRWAFDNKIGKASGIITVNNNYFFVATVKGIHNEGVAPLKDASSAIKDKLYQEKLQDKQTKTMAEKVKGKTSVADAAVALGLTPEHRDGVSLAATNLDPALLGAAAVAKEGQMVGPFAGSMGAYVLTVSNKQVGSFYTSKDAINMATQKSQYMSQLILPVMEDYDNVKDNRERFY